MSEAAEVLTDWPVPDLDEVSVVFPAGALSRMPPYDQIPAEFKPSGRTEWNRIVSAWFYGGLPPTTEFIPKPGIDKSKALRALGATLGSFAPKHEHKEAAVAFMMSCWFERVRNWERKA